MADLEKQIDLIKLETSQKNEKKAEASSQIAELEAEISILRSAEKQKHEILEQLVVSNHENTMALEELQESLQRFSGDPDQLIEQLREDYLALMQKEASLSNQLTLLTSEIEKDNQEQEDQLKAFSEQEKHVAMLEKEHQALLVAYHECSQKLQELLGDYQAKKSQLQDQKESYQDEQGKLFDLLDQKKAKEARLNSLEAIQKNHSQFYAGVRAVLQASNQLSGILGAVSEHLSFDRKYQTALEIALGASSQNIIVENEAAAKEAIAFLKRTKQGRATFLPLTTLKPRYLSESQERQVQSSPGFLGSAESLVSYDSHLAVIFKNLLNTTLIFDSIDNANKAAKLLQYKVRIVTLDGTELRPGGSFAGGANRQSNTTFIKPEIDSLQVSLRELNQHLLEQEKVVAHIQTSLQAAENQLLKLKDSGERARQEEQEVSFKAKQLQERLTDSQEILANMTKIQSQSRERDFQTQKVHLDQELERINQRKDSLSQEIESIKSNKDTINQKKLP